MPFPEPRNAAELACDLSPAANPEGYRAWWDLVPRRGPYLRWLWKEIVPRAQSDCAVDVRSTFWLHAVPDEWAPVAARRGWPRPAGGYYAQTLWLGAVPGGWARDTNAPSRPAGYYADTLWLHAVPDGWAPRPALVLGRGPYVQPNQGYYRWLLWEIAVPDDWAVVPDIGGWRASSGGYYAQWLWLHAIPDGWAPRPELAVGGQPDRGDYAFWFYHFAITRGFGARPSTGETGYYAYWLDRYFAGHVPAYELLLAEAAGYLDDARRQGPAPVDGWLGAGTHAAVVLTFDAEGNAAETCAITRALREEGVSATFYLLGRTARAIAADPVWRACLDGFDVGNHTESHPGGTALGPRALLAAYAGADQHEEIAAAEASLRSVFGAGGSFRTPWADGVKGFDAGVARSLVAIDDGPIASDSSVATLPGDLAAAPAAYARFALRDFPYPFTLRGGLGEAALVELPFAYPSDRAARAQLHLDATHAPAGPADAHSAVTLWQAIFDRIYEQKGVMVVLMHPQFQSADGTRPEALIALVRYVKTKPGVKFVTVTEAATRFRASR